MMRSLKSSLVLTAVLTLVSASTALRTQAEPTLRIQRGHAGPDLDVSETWVDFELREPGDSDSESVTVTNSGDRELKGLDVDLSGDRGFSMNSDCSDELAPGESCEVEVTFEEDEPGRYDAELQVDSNGGSARVHISGELKNRDRS